MSQTCHGCKKTLPKGQSFYEDHGVKVCLSCFRTSLRCTRCGFPAPSLKETPGLGSLCSFCLEKVEKKPFDTCHLCQSKIFHGMSHYQDHGLYICQPCFKDAKTRCFFCRFPKIEKKINGLGGLCQFCAQDILDEKTELDQPLEMINRFIEAMGRPRIKAPRLINQDIQAMFALQGIEPKPKVQFLDEFIQHAYPLYYQDGSFYWLPLLNKEWFLPVLAGQMTVAGYCQAHGLKNLDFDSPFALLVKGFCHWVQYRTAENLGFNQVKKSMARFPKHERMGDFPKFLAMSEYRKPAEILAYANEQIDSFALRYLK